MLFVDHMQHKNEIDAHEQKKLLATLLQKKEKHGRPFRLDQHLRCVLYAKEWLQHIGNFHMEK